MAEPLAMTTTVRDFIRQVYAETASTVRQVFAEDQVNTTLHLAQVRVCCGSEPINRVEGGYRLSEDTPWLAELCFGTAQAPAGAIMAATLPASGSITIAALPCLALQGIGAAWASRLGEVGIMTIGDLSRLDQGRVAVLMRQWRTRQVLSLYAKARTAMAPLPPLPRCALMTQSPVALLLRTPEQLSQESGVLDVVMASHLLHYLAGLCTALDESAVARLTLGEILTL